MLTSGLAAFDAALMSLQRAYADLLRAGDQQDLAILSERVGGVAGAVGAMMDGIEARLRTDRPPTPRWSTRVAR